MNFDELFSTTDQKNELCDTCLRNTHYLIVPKRTLSRIVAVALLTAFFVFVAGYFLGKKNLAEDFSHGAEHANFSDQINFALTSLYDKEVLSPKHEQKVTVVQQEDVEQPEVVVASNETQANQPTRDSSKKQLAQLFGGTEKAVNQFAQRLQAHGITVDIRKRSSKTARGKEMHWYQAVTKPYENESDLLLLVNRIKKLEKINNVQIIQIPV